MVYKRSEYGLQYKVSSLTKNVPVYKENLNYRHLRRERECAHTPLSWGGSEIDADSDGKVSPEENIDNIPVADLVIEEEDENVSDDEVEKEKRDALAKDKVICWESNTKDNDVEITQQNQDLRKSAKEKLNKYVSNENKDQSTDKLDKKCGKMGKTFVKPKMVEDKLFVKRSKPHRPDRCDKIPVARPKSAPANRPVSQSQEPEKNKAPFMAFGCGVNSRNLGNKKTFNVRATSAVYPAALRAQKRNQLVIEKQQEKQRSASARDKKKKALFNQKMARETIQWESEYRKSYPAYDNEEYATTDRSPRKQKSHFLQ